jgi:two-component system sporulation sensor kinase B
LYCDAIHLKEAILNILRNAIEAMDKEGKIEIRLFQTKTDLILKIRDNGCGISKPNLPYVVSPYFSTKKNALHCGLGLFYCRNVMQKHGGTLEIESIETEGTTISLKFPVKKLRKNNPNTGD